MLSQFPGKVLDVATVSAAYGPVDERLILVARRNAAEPQRASRINHRDHIGYVTGAETTGDGEVDAFEQSLLFPLRLEPVDRDFRLASLDVPATAPFANEHLRKNGPYRIFLHGGDLPYATCVADERAGVRAQMRMPMTVANRTRPSGNVK
jgi:hypothetical protein